MRVTCFGYYDDFARFFLGFRDAAESMRDDLEFFYFSLFPSGWLFALKRKTIVGLPAFGCWLKAFLRVRAWLFPQSRSEEYRDVSLTRAIRYNVRISGIAKDGFRRRLLCAYAQAWAEFLYDEFTVRRPDLLILSGDLRLSECVAVDVARALGITKVFFFEQGPFGTTMFDPEGVNAFSRIRRLPREAEISTHYTSGCSVAIPWTSRSVRKKHPRAKVYRALDHLLLGFLRIFFLCPPDLVEEWPMRYLTRASRHGSKAFRTADDSRPIVLVVLQVPHDVNMVFHSPLAACHSDIVRAVTQAAGSDFRVVVREHPLYAGRYEEELYEWLRGRPDQCVIDSTTPLKTAIENAAIVVVNNSTVGIEALALNRPVVSLGDSYYDQLPGIHKVNSLDRLPSILRSALHSKDANCGLNEFMDRALTTSLYEGHYRDDDLSFLNGVAAGLLRQSNDRS